MNIIDVTNYLKRKNELEILEEEVKKLQDNLIEQMNGQEIVYCGQYKLTYKDVNRTDVDKKKLKEMFPEVATQVERTTTYKRFSAK